MGMDKLGDLEISALLASKICHDVIGPVGAIYNGLEVLDEQSNDESAKAYALEVIRNFTVQASAKLQFARFAFGAAGSAGSLIDLATAEQITRGFVEYRYLRRFDGADGMGSNAQRQVVQLGKQRQIIVQSLMDEPVLSGRRWPVESAGLIEDRQQHEPDARDSSTFDDGACQDTTQVACDTEGGTYEGDGTSCSGVHCPLVLEPFVDALPVPPLAVPTSGTQGGVATYDIEMVQFQHQMHRDLPPTTVWGYDGIFPGPTILAFRDQPVTVNWIAPICAGTGCRSTPNPKTQRIGSQTSLSPMC